MKGQNYTPSEDINILEAKMLKASRDYIDKVRCDRETEMCQIKELTTKISTQTDLLNKSGKDCDAMKEEICRLTGESNQLKQDFQIKEIELQECKNVITQFQADFKHHFEVQCQYEQDTCSKIDKLEKEKCTWIQIEKGYKKQVTEMATRFARLEKENTYLNTQCTSAEQVKIMYEKYDSEVKSQFEKFNRERDNHVTTQQQEIIRLQNEICKLKANNQLQQLKHQTELETLKRQHEREKLQFISKPFKHVHKDLQEPVNATGSEAEKGVRPDEEIYATGFNEHEAGLSSKILLETTGDVKEETSEQLLTTNKEKINCENSASNQMLINAMESKSKADTFQEPNKVPNFMLRIRKRTATAISGTVSRDYNDKTLNTTKDNHDDEEDDNISINGIFGEDVEESKPAKSKGKAQSGKTGNRNKRASHNANIANSLVYPLKKYFGSQPK